MSNRFLSTVAILTAFLALPASATPLSPAPGLGQSVQIDRALTADEITPQQHDKLFGTQPLPPGAYRIRPVGTELCLSVDGRPEFDGRMHLYLGLRSCSDWPNYAVVYIMPHPVGGGYTIRWQNPEGPGRPDRFNFCATAARGVVLGPRRIDMIPCSAEGQDPSAYHATVAQWQVAGAEDQKFWFKNVGNQEFEINSIIGDDIQCFGMRGDSTAASTDALRWPCNGKDSQHFRLELVEAQWPGSSEWPTLNSQSWYWSPEANAVRWDGWRRLVSVQGVDIPGNDNASKPAAADNGAECAQICLSRRGCKAWTWTAQDFNGNATPICWIKNNIGRPINRGSANTSIFSGVVRP